MATLKEFEEALREQGMHMALAILERLRERDRAKRSIAPARRLTGRKMTPELARTILEMHGATNMTQQEIAFQLGVNQGRVNEVIKRGKWLSDDPGSARAGGAGEGSGADGPRRRRQAPRGAGAASGPARGRRRRDAPSAGTRPSSISATCERPLQDRTPRRAANRRVISRGLVIAVRAGRARAARTRRGRTDALGSRADSGALADCYVAPSTLRHIHACKATSTAWLPHHAAGTIRGSMDQDARVRMLGTTRVSIGTIISASSPARPVFLAYRSG